MKSVRPAPPANRASPVKRWPSTSTARESGVWPGASTIVTVFVPSSKVAPPLIRRTGPCSFEAACASTVAPVRRASRRTPERWSACVWVSRTNVRRASRAASASANRSTWSSRGSIARAVRLISSTTR